MVSIRYALMCMISFVPSLISMFPSPVTAPMTYANPIVLENQQPGSTGWQIGRTGFKVADDVRNQIKGFATATSVNKGSDIQFKVTVHPVQSYTIDIYRMGWYGGLGGRLMRHVAPRQAVAQPPCRMDASTGLLTCPWSVSYGFAVPSTWTSGIYVAVLTNASHYQNYIIFAVRDDARTSDFLYQQPVLTYQAYNKYPDDGVTGKSLYPNRSWGPNTLTGTRRAVKVSFDRPYFGNGAGEFFYWEVNFVHWVERSGYDISYSTSIDTDRNPNLLLEHRAWMSVGHDEYWTQREYDAVLAARDAGVNLAFFGANDVYWHVRLEPSALGVPRRIVVCYKDSRLDPTPTPGGKTIQWRQLGRPEQALIGIQFTSILKVAEDGGYPYVIEHDDSWVYSGTGARNGDSVPKIIGPEADRYMSNYPLPSGTGYTLLSRSPFINTVGRSDYGNSSVYRAPSGAWVFAAGAWRWSWALDREGYIDPRVQLATRNVLDRFLGTVPLLEVTSVLQPHGIYTAGTLSNGRIFAPTYHGEDDS